MRREDGSEWLLGRMETGDFIALPPTGEHATRLLDLGLTVAEVGRRLATETGQPVDVEGFVRDLIDLGFVQDVDGTPLRTPDVRRAALPWLLPRHVRWVLHPASPVVLLLLLATACAALVRQPQLLPGYRDLLWSPHGSLVLLSSAATAWVLALLHECGHLVAARAAGVPASIRLGTRLQFLVLQTDISGIELASRRHRLTAYLGGPAVNLAVASSSVLVLSCLAPEGAAHRGIALILVLALVQLPFQFLVFMRTDLYFVLQDLTGCRDLYGDGATYLRHLARRGARRDHRPRRCRAG